MNNDTNVIDLTDRIVTTELPAQRVETAIIPAQSAPDDTVRIPTYMGEPMLPPVPSRPGALPLLGSRHAVPTGARRKAAIAAAMPVGAALAFVSQVIG